MKATGAGDRDQLVSFRGKVFILSPSKGVLYFRASGRAFARLHHNGAISRQGKCIGRRSEIKSTGLEVVTAETKKPLADWEDSILRWVDLVGNRRTVWDP